jgi:hypothetical protein
MVFEFQLRSEAEWEPVGRAATPGERFDIEEAAVALRDLHEGYLPTGSYRVRATDIEDSRWCSAEVDCHGIFRRLD